MSTQRAAGRRPKDSSLTRTAVVEAAIDILDTSGESGLTFRVLADRLHSGSGAIYWHVANRNQLLDLACDAILAPVESEAPQLSKGDELDAIRTLALSLFDTLDRHPWIGIHLPSSPGLPSALRLLERIGESVRSFGVPAERQFYVATAVFTYVLAVAAQMTRNAQTAGAAHTQDEWLAEQATQWAQLDPQTHPFLHGAAADLRDHDDREQFIVGLDLLLAGIQPAARTRQR